jgi:hypothetical protein
MHVGVHQPCTDHVHGAHALCRDHWQSGSGAHNLPKDRNEQALEESVFHLRIFISISTFLTIPGDR